MTLLIVIALLPLWILATLSAIDYSAKLIGTAIDWWERRTRAFTRCWECRYNHTHTCMKKES